MYFYPQFDFKPLHQRRDSCGCRAGVLLEGSVVNHSGLRSYFSLIGKAVNLNNKFGVCLGLEKPFIPSLCSQRGFKGSLQLSHCFWKYRKHHVILQNCYKRLFGSKVTYILKWWMFLKTNTKQFTRWSFASWMNLFSCSHQRVFVFF